MERTSHLRFLCYSLATESPTPACAGVFCLLRVPKEPVMSHTQPSIVISSSDLERLETLLDRPQHAGSAGADLLRREINRADIRSPQDMPADVITMNSTARFLNVDSSEARELSLVYPGEADMAQGRVSVLAPVGCALLGLSVGQEIDWPGPDGRQLRLRVEEVLHQPEASGDFTR